MTGSSPVQDNRSQWVFRCRVLGGIIFLAMASLLVRSYWLQGVDGEYYAGISTSNAVHQKVIRPPRGVILSSDGAVLAANRPAYDLVFLPRGVPVARYEEIAGNIADLIEEEPKKILEAMKKGRRRPLTPVVLRSNIPRETLAAVLERKNALPGIMIDEHAIRSYPLGSEAAHLLGYINEVSEKEIEADPALEMGDLVGRVGVEDMLEPYLAGRKGKETLLLDALGQTVRVLGKKQATSGDRVTLTIDADLQRWSHEAFGGKHGALVALEPSTGRILALYSSPLYDPNIFVDARKSSLRSALFSDSSVPLFNRAMQAQYAPGSTFKTVTMIAGLMTGKLDPNLRIDCNGFYAGMKCWKWKEGGHRRMDLLGAFQNSCNVYFYRAGELIWSDPIAEAARAMGMGSKPGFGVGPEVSGVVPDAAWERAHVRGPDGEHWGTGDVRNTAIGQGYVVASPAQMAMVAAAAATGKRMKPQVIERIEDPAGHVVHEFRAEVVADLGLSVEDRDFVRAAMNAVVDGGTARRGAVQGLAVGGKTGTAQTPLGADHAWFIGAAPMDDPKIALCVFVEHAGEGGGKAAAPIAAEVLKRYAGKKGWIDDSN